MRSTRPLRLATLALLLLCGACSTSERVVVIRTDERVFLIRNGAPEYDGASYPVSEIEGWYAISPGYARDYLRWLSDEIRKKREEAIGAGAHRSTNP